MNNAVNGHALIPSATHAETDGILSCLRVKQCLVSEGLRTAPGSFYDITVRILVSHQHVLIRRKNHVRSDFPVVIQGIRQSEGKAHHQLDEDDAKDQHQIIRHILEQDPQTEPSQEGPGGKPPCFGALRAGQIMPQEPQGTELQLSDDDDEIDEKHQNQRDDGGFDKCLTAPDGGASRQTVALIVQVHRYRLKKGIAQEIPQDRPDQRDDQRHGHIVDHQLPLAVPGGPQGPDDGSLSVDGVADGDGKDKGDDTDEDIAQDPRGTGVPFDIRGSKIGGLPQIFRQIAIDLVILRQGLRKERLQKILRVLCFLHLISRRLLVAKGIVVMYPGMQGIKAFRSHHRHIKSEGIKHEIGIGLMEGQIMHITQEPYDGKFSVAHRDPVTDLYSDIAGMHPVDGDLRVCLRCATCVEGCQVDSAVTPEDPYGPVRSAVQVMILRLIPVKILIHAYGDRRKCVLQSVFLSDLIPFLLHGLFHRFMCLFVCFLRSGAIFLRRTRLLYGAVVIFLDGGINLRQDHILIRDPESFTLRTDALFYGLPDTAVKCLLQGFLHFLVRFPDPFFDIILPHICHLSAADGFQQVRRCFFCQFKGAVFQPQGLPPVPDRSQHAVVPHIHPGDQSDHKYQKDNDHQVFVPVGGKFSGDSFDQRILHHAPPYHSSSEAGIFVSFRSL